MPGEKGGRVRLSADAFFVLCVCQCLYVSACPRTRKPLCLCVHTSSCTAALRFVWGQACLQTEYECDCVRHLPRWPPLSSPWVSSEGTTQSCGTRLISSVIKINEVLIAAVIYANDRGTQDEDFLSLLQSEAWSGIWCVQEIASPQPSASDVVIVIVYYGSGDAGGGANSKSPLPRVC